MMSEDKCEYCSVCRYNHSEGRKHVYVKSHQQKLSVILNKFSEKVQLAKRCVLNPSVLEGELEPGSRVWCYCCDKDVPRHTTTGNISVQWGGLIQHLASSGHHKCTRRYWWLHHADHEKLQNFLIHRIELSRYTELMKTEVKKVEARIEAKQERTMMAGLVRDQMLQQTAALEQQNMKSFTVTKPPPVSFNNSSKGKQNHGNIHTGAIPPWLRQDDDDDDDDEEEDKDIKEPSCKKMCSIGPSEEQFKQHREHVIRSKLNPNRVGANFYKEKLNMAGDNWLPSFGGVWNYGPRSKYKKIQSKPSGRMYSAKNPSSSSVNGHISASNHVVKPYVRKRHA